MLQCNHTEVAQTVQDAAWMCANMAHRVCGTNSKFVNWYSVYWCWIEGHKTIFTVLAALIIVILYKWINVLVRQYIFQAADTIVGKSYGIWQGFFLILANAAGHIITTSAAATTAGGSKYTLGSAYGGTLLMLSIATCSSVVSSGKDFVAFPRTKFWRDTIGYVIALLVTVYWIFFVDLSITYSLFLVPLIVVYFLQVHNEHNELTQQIYADAQVTRELTELHRIGDSGVVQSVYESEGPSTVHELGNSMIEMLLTATKQHKQGKKQTSLLKEDMEVATSVEKLDEINTHINQLQLKFALDKSDSRNQGSAVNPWVAGAHLLGAPFRCWLNLAHLPAEPSQYSKERCFAFTVVGSIFTGWYFTGGFGPDYFMIAGPMALSLAALFYFKLPANSDQPPHWFKWIAFGSILSSTLWICFFTGILVDLLGMLSVLLNVEKCALGFVVFGIGNTLPDVFITNTMAKQGLPSLALVGSSTNELFNLLLTLTIAVTTISLYGAPQEFNLGTAFTDTISTDDLKMLAVLLFLLVVSAVYFCFSSYKLGKTAAKYGQLIFYGMVFSIAYDIYKTLSD